MAEDQVSRQGREAGQGPRLRLPQDGLDELHDSAAATFEDAWSVGCLAMKTTRRRHGDS